MEKFKDIIASYEGEFDKHGDSPASILSPKGRQELRFQALDGFIQQGHFSLLDYGCGLGHLVEYLDQQKADVEYHGVDIVPRFVEANRKKFATSRSFKLIAPDEDISGQYDVVFASGVFNMKASENDAESRSFAFQNLERLFGLCRNALVCDFASSYVDFIQDDAQHFSVGEIADFAATKLSRKLQIRHDYLPYEFTLVVAKDGEIKRPDNIYAGSRLPN